MKYKHIEITVATVILILALFSLLGSFNNYITGGNIHNFDADLFLNAGLEFNFYINFLLPFVLLFCSLYASFIWVACSLPNKYITQRRWLFALLSIVPGWLILWALLTLRDCLLRPYQSNILIHSTIIELQVTTYIYLVLLAYQVIKQLAFWLIDRERLKQPWHNNTMIAEIVWFILLWGICLLASIFTHAYWGITATILLLLPCAFLVYLAALYYLIPLYYKKIEDIQFWAITALVTGIINIPLNGLYTARATHNRIIFLEFFFLFWGLQMVVIVPICLYIYQLRQQRNAELTGLKTNLGTSNANLQYLRSQINPHFLFNALNTLYGTALVEKAEKTGEGIQKLGDMMRFMLHENNQDRIALSRELEYIHNYVDLQTMRLALSPDVTVNIQIEDIVGYDEIAPMLLIPFIENAYKHGISLQEKSWINVYLYKRDAQLHLDVHNSVHPVNPNDPERFQSGTGLDNVKQRLHLLYPNRHELVVRQNAKEFFIHLTITLHHQQPSSL